MGNAGEHAPPLVVDTLVATRGNEKSRASSPRSLKNIVVDAVLSDCRETVVL